MSILLNDRLWQRHQPPTRLLLPAPQPVDGGVGGVEPQTLRHPAVMPEAPLAEAAVNLQPSAPARPNADPSPPPGAIAHSDRVARSPSSSPKEAAVQPHLLLPARVRPRPIRDLVFAPVLATGLDGNPTDGEVGVRNRIAVPMRFLTPAFLANTVPSG